jgi:hypothetical protein
MAPFLLVVVYLHLPRLIKQQTDGHISLLGWNWTHYSPFALLVGSVFHCSEIKETGDVLNQEAPSRATLHRSLHAQQ